MTVFIALDKRRMLKLLSLFIRIGEVNINSWVYPRTELHSLGTDCFLHVPKFKLLINFFSIENRMLAIQDKKKNLISGAFRQTVNEMRQQRIQDILSIFGL